VEWINPAKSKEKWQALELHAMRAVSRLDEELLAFILAPTHAQYI